MRLLPPLATAAGAIRLPLSDRAAARIAVALLSDSAGQRRDHLQTALADDAALALWAVAIAWRRGGSEARTSGELADWLSTAGAELWTGEAAKDANASSNSKTVDAWSHLAAISHGVAMMARQIAEGAGLDAEAACFLGLLHAAPAWLAAVDADPALAQSAKLLPPELSKALRHIVDAPAESLNQPADCVAIAARAVGSGGPVALGNTSFDPHVVTAQMVEAGDAWRREVEGAEQFAALTRRLARLEKLEQQFQQTLEAEKLESLKELAQAAGHEINNPLANISARAQTLLQEERDPGRRRKLAAIYTQAMRAHEMIADMMLFARPPQPKFETLSLVPLLASIVDELQPSAHEQKTTLVFHPPVEAVQISADRHQVAVAVRALVVNALEALVTGGQVDISLRTGASDDKQPADSSRTDEAVQIAVSDNGPGISAEVRRHLFDPFYSGREAGRGLGFGLSKCWRIAAMHDGRVEVSSEPGGGAVFSLIFPVKNSRVLPAECGS